MAIVQGLLCCISMSWVLHMVCLWIFSTSKVSMRVMFLFLPESFPSLVLQNTPVWCSDTTDTWHTYKHFTKMFLLSNILAKKTYGRFIPAELVFSAPSKCQKNHCWVTSWLLYRKKSMCPCVNIQTYHTGGHGKVLNMYHCWHCRVFIWVV